MRALIDLGVDFTEGGKLANPEKNPQSTGEINRFQVIPAFKLIFAAVSLDLDQDCLLTTPWGGESKARRTTYGRHQLIVRDFSQRCSKFTIQTAVTIFVSA